MRFIRSLGTYLPLVLLACIPFVGQIILSVLILQESRSRSSAFLWILVVWVLPYVGPLAYLALGHQGLSRAQSHGILLAFACTALFGLLIGVLVLAISH